MSRLKLAVPIAPQRGVHVVTWSLGGLIVFNLALGSLAFHQFVWFAVTAAAVAISVRLARDAAPGTRSQPVALLVTFVIFTAATIARGATDQLGDLSANRAVLPDALALTGYATLTYSLLRSKGRNKSESHKEAILDSALIALSALALTWLFLLSPVLERTDTTLWVRSVLIAYPTWSLFLLATTLRRGFDDAGYIGFTSTSLLLAISFFVAGDVLYGLTELSLLHLPQPVLDTPYLIATLMLPVSSLLRSPDEQRKHGPRLTGRERAPMAPGRLGLVGLRVVGPPFAVAYAATKSDLDVQAILVISVGIAVVAAIRLGRSMRRQAMIQLELQRRVSHDDLTGLVNRAELLERMATLGNNAASVDTWISVFFVDLDRFKAVNDTYGHAFGDDYLTAISNRIRITTRPDAEIARVGGDEFVIVMLLEAPEATAAEAAALAQAEHLRSELRHPVILRGTEVPTAVSIGIVTVPCGYEVDGESLLNDADAAMYQAKRRGRDAVEVFDPRMRESIALRLALERELRHAVERDEIWVAFQPIMSMTSGRIEGFEALARWKHPTWGPVAPDQFIPIAEDIGMIDEIGEWVLDRACKRLAGWTTTVAGAEACYVAVNLSVRQFHRPDLADTVASTLHRHSLPGTALHLEVTESLLANNLSQVAETLSSIKDLGVEISLDDFGTGYSSLTYLHRFPVDRVKIDRAFVSALTEGSAEEGLIVAMIAMADALGLETIAEGVETQEQAEHVRALGCTSAQGYLWSRPLPPEEVAGVLVRYNDPRVAHLAFSRH